jgi:glycosyltransferase involved in cell wall biosynthesis
MKALITAPSLDENENVSGISTLVRNIIARGGPGFVHFEAGRKDGEAADIVWFARQASLPFRFFQSLLKVKPDIVHINTAFIPLAITRDVALAAVARLANYPILLHIHGGPFVMEEITNPAIKLAAERLLKLATVVVVFSETEEKSLLKRFPGMKFRVLPNAVPVEDAPEVERTPGEKTIIFFGRLNKSKGLDHIISACRALNDQGFKFKYVCYGAGPEMISFCSQMGAILGDRFNYLGVAKGKEKWEALSRADIFFQPSRDEGLPIALLEAMAAGCVPVMSVSGAVADVIEDGRNGFLIEAGDTTQTVGRLKFLLSESEIGWKKLRENARKTVRERFDFSEYMKKLKALYSEVVAAK